MWTKPSNSLKPNLQTTLLYHSNSTTSNQQVDTSDVNMWWENQKATWHGGGVTVESDPKHIRNQIVNTVTHDMRAFFDDAVEIYCQLASINKNSLPAQYVPFGPETRKDFGIGSVNTPAIDPKHYDVDNMEETTKTSQGWNSDQH